MDLSTTWEFIQQDAWFQEATLDNPTTCARRYSVAVEALVVAKRYVIQALEASIIRNAGSSISPA